MTCLDAAKAVLKETCLLCGVAYICDVLLNNLAIHCQSPFRNQCSSDATSSRALSNLVKGLGFCTSARLFICSSSLFARGVGSKAWVGGPHGGILKNFIMRSCPPPLPPVLFAAVGSVLPPVWAVMRRSCPRPSWPLPSKWRGACGSLLATAKL